MTVRNVANGDWLTCRDQLDLDLDTKRELTVAEANLLDGIESAIRHIAYPVDMFEMFHSQVEMVLESAGFWVIREVTMDTVMSRNNRPRRLDLVVVHKTATVAIELDNDDIPLRTLVKFRDLPVDVLRMAVLRHPVSIDRPNAIDRIVTMRTDNRAVEWLTSGHAILDESSLHRGMTDGLERKGLLSGKTRDEEKARRQLLRACNRKGGWNGAA